MTDQQHNKIVHTALAIGGILVAANGALHTMWVSHLEKQVKELQSQCEVITHRPVALSFETLKRIADEVEKQEP